MNKTGIKVVIFEISKTDSIYDIEKLINLKILELDPSKIESIQKININNKDCILISFWVK